VAATDTEAGSYGRLGGIRMIVGLYVVTIVLAALLTGNEFAIGAIIHPVLSRLDTATHVRAVQALGRRYGKVMPFWMAGVLVLEVVILFVVGPRWHMAWTWAAVSAGLVLVAIIFSVVGPVPINNRVVGWDPERLPEGWEKERARWDQLHMVRVVILIVSLAALVVSAIVGV
jgi:hypothetical protein